ncbi:MAG: response regulator transcription factor [Renibacterium sp.]|nr:response regulator transcription factor [Renibacterium sp.]
MPHVLVIEDDHAIRTALLRGLADRGYASSSAATGAEGLHQSLTGQADLVVLDLGLPDLDGINLLKMLRAVSDVPVVVVTARDDDSSLVAALEHGADDYVTKPYRLNQLDARIKAVLRRRQGEEDPASIRVGELQIDLKGRAVRLRDAELQLTPKEFDLLAYLAARAGVVVSKRELIAEVWQLAYAGGDKTVDVHLSWLRRKLGEDAHNARYLHTVRGAGVKLVDPENASPRTGGAP